MTASDTVDMEKFRESRRALVSIMDKVVAAGWISASQFWDAHSEVTVYLCDAHDPVVVVFSCRRFDLAQVPFGLPVWEHLIRSFDVIADPRMAFDDEHLAQTVELTKQALGGSERMMPPSENLAPPNQEYLHYVILVNRGMLNQPVGTEKVLDSVRLLTSETVQALTQHLLTTGAGE